MAERNPPSWLQAGSHPAEQDRLLVAGMIKTSGVCGDDDLKVTQLGTPAMTVNIAAGAAFVAGTESDYQGVYHVQNDDDVELDVEASDPTNGRKDLVVARVYDAEYSGSDNEFVLEVITGTPSGSPATPATPDNAIPLATLTVAANASTVTTANITDLRKPATFRPSIVNGDRYPTSSLGLAVYRNSGDKNEGVEVFNGTSWRKPWNVAWGEVAAGARTSDSSNFNTSVPTTEITNSGSFTAVGNRRYEIVAQVAIDVSAADNGALIALREGSTSGTILQKAWKVVTSSSHAESLTVVWRGTFTAGSTIVYLTGQRYKGDGNVKATAASDAACWLLIRDVGPAGAPT